MLEKSCATRMDGHIIEMLLQLVILKCMPEHGKKLH